MNIHVKLVTIFATARQRMNIAVKVAVAVKTEKLNRFLKLAFGQKGKSGSLQSPKVVWTPFPGKDYLKNERLSPNQTAVRN